MKYEYSITNEAGKYYRSKHDSVSADCCWVEHEIDATFMDESDLLYILNESDIHIGKYGRIHLSYKRNYIGSITIDDFNGPEV